MPVDASACPLCSQANLCAMEIEKITGITRPPCWCASLKMDAGLIEKIPLSHRNLACLCQDCATRMPKPSSTTNS